MSKRFLIKLGAPILALSLIAACGTDEEQDPIDEEAPLAPEDEAPLNQEDDNNDTNPAEEDGAGDGLMDEEGINGNGDIGTDEGTGTDDTNGGGTNGTEDGTGNDGTQNEQEDELIEDENQ
ncbi:hypothetical protein [Oceanobacillus bengalensis]|uniref:DNA primase n=1 Tax=Oceanobacillus bengalensis TaxID=1435466 RepID=A0A494YYT5_9BACI|nr:hypothetical protein [Oceanobacillus bengalensis]RKQ15336.1 hypothetical protein D8M05_10070 [Oceanobacillus bengalensis]